MGITTFSTTARFFAREFLFLAINFVTSVSNGDIFLDSRPLRTSPKFSLEILNLGLGAT